MVSTTVDTLYRTFAKFFAVPDDSNIIYARMDMNTNVSKGNSFVLF